MGLWWHVAATGRESSWLHSECRPAILFRLPAGMTGLATLNMPPLGGGGRGALKDNGRALPTGFYPQPWLFTRGPGPDRSGLHPIVATKAYVYPRVRMPPPLSRGHDVLSGGRGTLSAGVFPRLTVYRLLYRLPVRFSQLVDMRGATGAPCCIPHPLLPYKETHGWGLAKVHRGQHKRT